MTSPIAIQRLEGATLLVLAVVAFAMSDLSWWWLNSMASHPAYAVGLLVLPALAGAPSVSPAMYVAAGVLALGSLLYIPAWRQRVAGADQSLRTTR